MKSNKALGPDRIQTKLLKDAADSTPDSLAETFSLSIQTAIFPDERKIANVSPIHKSGSKANCGNYRPISVISALAKLFERLVYNHQLISYLEDNNIITKLQSGFRSKHYTESALLRSTTKWLLNMDEGLIDGVTFLDLTKAFETVGRSILTSKPKAYGVKGIAHRCFRSYLTNRVQIYKVNQKLSNSKRISCGGFPGVKLRTITLFNLY